jgi:hypothetical protein
MNTVAVPDLAAIVISIILMAFTLIVSGGLELRMRPLPYAQALLIATVRSF